MENYEKKRKKMLIHFGVYGAYMQSAQNACMYVCERFVFSRHLAKTIYQWKKRFPFFFLDSVKKRQRKKTHFISVLLSISVHTYTEQNQK